ncbi:MAG: hypothetical protein GY696_26635 [Gammaproteobacteria bacterium]|nr:hypothetical protein [Gammaproteobacteria bacterium]
MSDQVWHQCHPSLSGLHRQREEFAAGYFAGVWHEEPVVRDHKSAALDGDIHPAVLKFEDPGGQIWALKFVDHVTVR